jgi:nicotinamide riboside kinase
MSNTKIIVISGPESTGKSTLTKQLADFYKAPYIPEIAREYIEKLNRPYCFDDVLSIARKQIKVENEMLKQKPDYLFIDTDLIVTKVWLKHCYNKYPKWIDKYLSSANRFLYLLCFYDIPWKYDPVRENPNIRDLLFKNYKTEIENYRFDYRIVKGIGEERLINARQFIKF